MIKILKTLIFCSVLFLCTIPSHLSANTIGTFSSARPNTTAQFNLFDGGLLSNARAALTNDGHILQNLDAGIDATSLSTVDILYLNTANTNGIEVLTVDEVNAIVQWVNDGGVLIIQGDGQGYGISYNNLATEFGVSYVFGFDSFNGDIALTTPYPPLTNGPFGTVSSVHMAAAGGIDSGTSSGLSLAEDSVGSFLYVLAPDTGHPSSGTIVFLTDVNTFDDHTDGFITPDSGTLWRNLFALVSNSTPSYTVGGTVSGLSGSVTLQNNGGDDLVVTADGPFTFATALLDNTGYAVIVSTQPSGQTCTVSNGSGSVSGANVTDVSVECLDDVVPPVFAEPVPVPINSRLALALMALMLIFAGGVVLHRRL